MAVHAHPDDEASGTGGVLAHYSDLGVRTVLVTCTNGELGDAPGGIKPGEPGHDEATVVALRRDELAASCRQLGVGHLHHLGYHDSGMMGWPQNDAPGSFWSLPVATAAAPLVELMDRYRPQVVVTYDERGFYGHPDHIQAHRITMAAAAASVTTPEIYYTAIARSALVGFADRMRAHGLEPPEQVEEDPDFGAPDETIAVVMDCSHVADRKYDALAAHASQSDNIFFFGPGPSPLRRALRHRGLRPGRRPRPAPAPGGRPVRRPPPRLSRTARGPGRRAGPVNGLRAPQ